MESKIRKIIQHSQSLNLDFPHIDSWIEDWAKAKKPFLDKMGGLIYELPNELTFQMTSDMKKTRFKEFIEYISENICLYDGALYYFLMDQEEGFFENKVVKPYKIPHGETIPVGMKIGKAIRTFFKDRYSIEELDKIISEMSMVIQENVIRGKLCISVHPLDFLSSSENNHSWRSCHSLDGDYRAGNLSYMLDNCTVMVYLKSDKPDCKLPRFPEDVPWNNKKWRCLFHFDFERGIVWAGRQYPFTSDNILDSAKVLFAHFNYFCDKNLISSYNTGRWIDEVKKDSINIDGVQRDLLHPHIFADGIIIPIDAIVKESRNALNYNDILHSSVYNPKYLIFDIKNYNLNFYNTDFKNPLIIGKACKCPQCGDKVITSSNNFICDNCRINFTDESSDEIGYCSSCGRHIILDGDMCWEDEYYCEDCFNKMFSRCSECHFIISPGMEEEDDDGNILCPSCAELKNREETYNDPFWIFN